MGQLILAKKGQKMLAPRQIYPKCLIRPKFRPEIKALLANGSTQKFIANRYDTTPANLHNWIKKHGIKKGNPVNVLP